MTSRGGVLKAGGALAGAAALGFPAIARAVGKRPPTAARRALRGPRAHGGAGTVHGLRPLARPRFHGDRGANLDLVLALADRLFALERGAVFHQGPAQPLLTNLDYRKQVLWVYRTQVLWI